MKNKYTFPLKQELFIYDLPGIETVFIGDDVQVSIIEDLLPPHCQVDLLQATFSTLKKVKSWEQRQLVQALRTYLETTKQPLDADLGGRIGSGIGCCVSFIGGFYGMVLGLAALPIGLATAVMVTIVLASLVGVGLIIAGTAVLGLAIGWGLIESMNHNRMTTFKSKQQLKDLLDEIGLSLKQKTGVIANDDYYASSSCSSFSSICSSHSSVYFFPIDQKQSLQSEILEDCLSIRSLP